MTTQTLRQLVSGGVFLIAVCTAPAVSAGVPIKINAWGIHHGGQIVYRYQIENNSASTIYQADIGLNSPGKELPGLPWSLNPDYSDVPVPLDAAYCKPFYAMDCTIAVFQFDYMPEPKTNIMMQSLESSMKPPPKVLSGAAYIRPGALSTIAELYIAPAYQSPGYLTAYGEVYLLDNNTKNPDGTIVTSVEIPFTKLDVTPPVLSIALSPATIWPPNNKAMPVTATITVTDDYDPEPEIKLESITASEPLAANDIQGAQLGTDDRSFSLMATRAGNNLAGRVYTVTYSATDASGNKATASATVAVPHDQGK
jgi:hypothetical protein